MKRIVVTGGSGRLGRFVVDYLLAQGMDVLNLDRVAPIDGRSSNWIADLTSIGDVYQALHGRDAVIHLAAWQAPGLTSDATTFANNVTATYNVLKAASDSGIEHVVIASSVAAYGYLYAPELESPEYLPVDEAHPSHPVDSYGLSKLVGEQIADSFARLQPQQAIVSLRLPGIHCDGQLESFLRRNLDRKRRARGFWSYLDARDAARACGLALYASLHGHHVFNVAAPDSGMQDPTGKLVAEAFQRAPELRRAPDRFWSGIDSTKFEQMLGFHVEHTYGTGAAESV